MSRMKRYLEECVEEAQAMSNRGRYRAEQVEGQGWCVFAPRANRPMFLHCDQERAEKVAADLNRGLAEARRHNRQVGIPAGNARRN